MSALQWFVIIQAIIGSVLTVAMIGKPRKPMTPGGAAIALCIHITVVILVLTVLAP
jgi:hypothetical protein